jgi:hypothetical protein
MFIQRPSTGYSQSRHPVVIHSLTTGHFSHFILKQYVSKMKGKNLQIKDGRGFWRFFDT